GVILVALDPFYLAHSRVHHLDGLLTTFVTFSVIGMTLYLLERRSLWPLLLSAFMAGLAMANKAPGMFLAPWAGLTLAWGAWKGGREGRSARLIWAGRALLLWGAVAALTVIAVWPAMWTNPRGTLLRMIEGALEEGTQPHAWSNYFWFARREDPGVAFYPVAWLFRTTVPVMIGLFALSHRRNREVQGLAPALIFALGFTLFLTASPKKFDRYLLPIFPALDLLAAAGWATLLKHISSLPWRWLQRLPATITATVVGVALAAIQFLLLWPARPYYLSYYNPLVGGPSMAARILLVGWGEAAELAAHYLNAKPNAQNMTVATDMPKEFEPFFVGRTVHVADLPVVEPDYFVFYLSHDQRHFMESRRRLFDQLKPECVLTSNGIPYARVHLNEAYEAEVIEILQEVEKRARSLDEVILMNAEADLLERYSGSLSIHLVVGPPREDFTLTRLQPLMAGRQRVWLLTFPDVNEKSADLLDDLLDQRGRRSDYIEINGVAATRYVLRGGALFVPSPLVEVRAKVGRDILLVGYDVPKTELKPGESFPLRLYWHSRNPVRQNLKVFTHLLGPDGQMYGQADSVPQGGAWPTLWWQPGETVLDDYELTISADAPPGDYVIAVGMYEMDTMKRLPICFFGQSCLEEDRFLIRGLRVATP
ncbi:MAG: phospholipid carrier-dependent glycosyltransferase, partial [Chloroflexi bacterium]|nr:phospholipid carrier-dependent glycosyltransferase [Chloroflexota bacterium]